MSIALIVSWYLCGAWAAGWMVQRGHSPVPWWVGAAVLGALVLVLAVPVARRAGRAIRWAVAPLPTAPEDRVVVGLVDDEGAVVSTARTVARTDDVLVAVRGVGFEATSRLVDTGELERADAAMAVASRRWPGQTRTAIGCGPLPELVATVTDAHRPSVIVRGPLAPLWRSDLRRSVQLGAAMGRPVLHAPAALRPAPAARSTVERVA